MSKPITITIPDSLHSRLKKYKEKLNVSQVCQKAIEEKISDWERKAEDLEKDPDMEAIISRLRMEKSRLENEWKEIGYKTGLLRAKVEEFESLRFLATKMKTTNEQIQGDTFDPNELDDHEYSLYTDYWLEYLKHPDEYFDGRLPADQKGADFLAWEDGFFEGVRRFWDQVKDKL